MQVTTLFTVQIVHSNTNNWQRKWFSETRWKCKQLRSKVRIKLWTNLVWGASRCSMTEVSLTSVRRNHLYKWGGRKLQMEVSELQSQESTRYLHLFRYAEFKQLHIFHKEHPESCVWTRALRFHYGKSLQLHASLMLTSELRVNIKRE